MYVMLLNGFNVCKFSLWCPLQTPLLSLCPYRSITAAVACLFMRICMCLQIFKKWNARIIHNNVQHSERPLKLERNKTTAHTSLFQSNINVIKISLSSYFPVNILFVLVSPQFISILWHFYVSLHPHVNCFVAQMLSVLFFCFPFCCFPFSVVSISPVCSFNLSFFSVLFLWYSFFSRLFVKHILNGLFLDRLETISKGTDLFRLSVCMLLFYCFVWILSVENGFWTRKPNQSILSVFPSFFFFLWILFYLINSQMDTCCFLVSLPSYNCVSMYPNCVGCCRCRKINLCTCSA